MWRCHSPIIISYLSELGIVPNVCLVQKLQPGCGLSEVPGEGPRHDRVPRGDEPERRRRGQPYRGGAASAIYVSFAADRSKRTRGARGCVNAPGTVRAQHRPRVIRHANIALLLNWCMSVVTLFRCPIREKSDPESQARPPSLRPAPALALLYRRRGWSSTLPNKVLD